MHSPRALFPGLIVAFALGAVVQTQAHECRCNGIVLNGSLNTADFDGGVGYGTGYASMEVIGYTMTMPSVSAFAFAHAHAFAFAGSHAFAFAHGMSGHGGMHGGFGGGGHR